MISLIEHKSKVDYHEGSDTWTAPFHLRERIFMHEIFEEYTPDFTYFLVNNQDFSKEELLEHQDEMSLIMLINIQDSDARIAYLETLLAEYGIKAAVEK